VTGRRQKSLINNSLEQSSFWEGNSPSPSQEISRRLRNPKVHYRLLNYMNSAHTLSSHFFKFHFNIIFPLPFRFSNYSSVFIISHLRLCRSKWLNGLRCYELQQLEHWNLWFESLSDHGCTFAFFSAVLTYPVLGVLLDVLNTQDRDSELELTRLPSRGRWKRIQYLCIFGFPHVRLRIIL
jgi:hypothetical protein